MHDEIRIASGDASAAIAPSHGGALLRFEIGGQHILRPASAAAVISDVLAAACYPCVPYFGRLADEVAIDGGRRWLAPTHPAIGVIHGEGWRRRWVVAERRAAGAVLGLEHRPAGEGDWPFPFYARQSFALSSDELEIVLSVTNLAAGPAPASIALHPFFPRTQATRLAFRATGVWSPPMTAPFEGGERIAFPDAIGNGTPAPLPLDTRDLTYLSVDGAASIDAGGALVSVTTDAPHLHLYAPAGEDFFCLEPTSAQPGGLLTDPACRLEPGATRSLRTRIARQS